MNIHTAKFTLSRILSLPLMLALLPLAPVAAIMWACKFAESRG